MPTINPVGWVTHTVNMGVLANIAAAFRAGHHVYIGAASCLETY